MKIIVRDIFLFKNRLSHVLFKYSYSNFSLKNRGKILVIPNLIHFHKNEILKKISTYFRLKLFIFLSVPKVEICVMSFVSFFFSNILMI